MTAQEMLDHDRRDAASADLWAIDEDWRMLGVVEYPQGGSIVVEVRAMPARFYRLSVSSTEETTTTLTTGSGTLSNYLRAAELFALDMLGVEATLDSEHSGPAFEREQLEGLARRQRTRAQRSARGNG